LSKQSEIYKLAGDFKKQFSRLNVLVNNVGLLESSKRLTADGLEVHFAVNVVTPFLLTHLLLDTLKQGRPSRVINVTGGMPFGKIDLQNLQAEKSFQGLATYSHAKRMIAAMSLEMVGRP
jgi:NAD(P)-dependent dehydrogenase (short-subunit alcohol dehydrogenase family)